MTALIVYYSMGGNTEFADWKMAERLKADLLKIMHHGADTSGSGEFITAVSPKVAVCMGNHILNNLANGRYAKVGCTPYQTWRDGDVCVTFTGEDVEVWASNLQTTS